MEFVLKNPWQPLCIVGVAPSQRSSPQAIPTVSCRSSPQTICTLSALPRCMLAPSQRNSFPSYFQRFAVHAALPTQLPQSSVSIYFPRIPVRPRCMRSSPHFISNDFLSTLLSRSLPGAVPYFHGFLLPPSELFATRAVYPCCTLAQLSSSHFHSFLSVHAPCSLPPKEALPKLFSTSARCMLAPSQSRSPQATSPGGSLPQNL